MRLFWIDRHLERDGLPIGWMVAVIRAETFDDAEVIFDALPIPVLPRRYFGELEAADDSLKPSGEPGAVFGCFTPCGWQ